ncbi:MAG: hypothetical protein DRG78_00380 [Epsilonproteobacteria bacterium]|nr:MAG: hypothetical protein DRG78_00380 [Campylobacterota bacterium]
MNSQINNIIKNVISNNRVVAELSLLEMRSTRTNMLSILMTDGSEYSIDNPTYETIIWTVVNINLKTSDMVLFPFLWCDFTTEQRNHITLLCDVYKTYYD